MVNYIELGNQNYLNMISKEPVVLVIWPRRLLSHTPECIWDIICTTGIYQ